MLALSVVQYRTFLPPAQAPSVGVAWLQDQLRPVKITLEGFLHATDAELNELPCTLIESMLILMQCDP